MKEIILSGLNIWAKEQRRQAESQRLAEEQTREDKRRDLEQLVRSQLSFIEQTGAAAAFKEAAKILGKTWRDTKAEIRVLNGGVVRGPYAELSLIWNFVPRKDLPGHGVWDAQSVFCNVIVAEQTGGFALMFKNGVSEMLVTDPESIRPALTDVIKTAESGRIFGNQGPAFFRGVFPPRLKVRRYV